MKKKLVIIASCVVVFLLVAVLILLPSIKSHMLQMCKTAFHDLKNAQSMHFEYDWTYTFPTGPQHVIYEVWKDGDNYLQFKTYENGSQDIFVIKNGRKFTLLNYADNNWSSVEHNKADILGAFWENSDWSIFDESSMRTKISNRQLQITLVEYVPDGDLVGQNLRRHWTFHFSLSGELKAISLKQLSGANTDLSASPIDACFTFVDTEQTVISTKIDQYSALIDN